MNLQKDFEHLFFVFSDPVSWFNNVQLHRRCPPGQLLLSLWILVVREISPDVSEQEAECRESEEPLFPAFRCL